MGTPSHGVDSAIGTLCIQHLSRYPPPIDWSKDLVALARIRDKHAIWPAVLHYCTDRGADYKWSPTGLVSPLVADTVTECMLSIHNIYILSSFVLRGVYLFGIRSGTLFCFAWAGSILYVITIDDRVLLLLY